MPSGFSESETGQLILSGCESALKAASDCQRARILSQMVMISKLRKVPAVVLRKLQVACGSTDAKRITHINDVEQAVISC